MALQFTKETIAHVGTMSWDASVNYTAAKFAELTSRQSGASSSRAIAIAEIRLGIVTLKTNSVLAGIIMILRGIVSTPSIFWCNGIVRRFLGTKS